MFDAVQVLNVFILTLLCVHFICLGKSCYSISSVILLFVKTFGSIFPFDVWDKFWGLIRPVPEVSFLL